MKFSKNRSQNPSKNSKSLNLNNLSFKEKEVTKIELDNLVEKINNLEPLVKIYPENLVTSKRNIDLQNDSPSKITRQIILLKMSGFLVSCLMLWIANFIGVDSTDFKWLTGEFLNLLKWSSLVLMTAIVGHTITKLFNSNRF